jgi:hypothetical protein
VLPGAVINILDDVPGSDEVAGIANVEAGAY